MPGLELSFLLDVGLSYVTFGLTIYAIAGLATNIWISRKAGKPRKVLRDLCLAYSSIGGLLVLDASRQIWDSFHLTHLPLGITRVAVPIMYLLLGNTVASFAGAANRSPHKSAPRFETEQVSKRAA